MPKKPTDRNPREERIIAGFEDIQRFVEEYGRARRQGENDGIFKRIYAIRLRRLRSSADCLSVIEHLDWQGLLNKTEIALAESGAPSDDAPLEPLSTRESSDGFAEAKLACTDSEKKTANEITQRERRSRSGMFEDLVQQVQQERQLLEE